MALTTETDLLTAIKSHRRTLLEREWHQQSLENGFPVMGTTEVQDVLKQVEDNADSFYTDDEDDEHEECHNGGHLCADCLGTEIDRAHDMADMER